MPYKLSSNGLCVQKADGETVKCHDTHGQALAHLRALYANVPDAGKGAAMGRKTGARHSTSDMQLIQTIHDHAETLGAQCGEPMSKSALKAFAINESWDIQQAAQALANVASLAANEINEADDDPLDVQQLANVMRQLLVFIGDEIDEMLNGDMAGKAISKREDVNPKEGVNQYGDVKFADEKNKKYPIDTEEHIRAAWNYINKADNAAKYDASEVAQIKKRIVAAWKDKIDKAGPPAAQEKSIAEATLSFAYVKSLHLPHDEQYFRDVLAVKSVGADGIRGYTMLWGSPDLVDVENDFFTAKTNFWDGVMGKSIRPLTWDHAQDPATKSEPIIGQIENFGDDEIGRWYEAQLKRNHQYRKAIDQLIGQRAIGTSSDSAPQYVVREKAKSGANWLKQWPWFASALTTTPAEPRMFDSVHFKGIGVDVTQLGEVSQTATQQVDRLLRRYEVLKRSI